MNTPLTDSSQSSVRRVRWLLITAAILLPILLIVTAAWMVWFGPQRKINAEIARIRAAGEPVTPDELDAFYAYPPGDEDVTNLWLNAIAPLGSKEYGAAITKIPFVGLVETPPFPGEAWSEIEAAEAFLLQQAETLKGLHEAAERGGAARYPLNLPAGMNVLLSHVQVLRAAARLLELEARVRMHRGDTGEALRSIQAIHRLGDSLKNEPLFISLLVQIAIRQIALGELRLLLGIGRSCVEDLAQLQSELRAGDAHNGIYRAIVGERAITIQTFSNPTAVGSPAGGSATGLVVWRLASRGAFAAYLENMRRLVSATRLTWKEAHDEIQDVALQVNAQGPLRRMLLTTFMPSTESLFNAATRTTASTRSADVAIAVELFHRRNGQLPESLQELVPEFLPQVPEDPFSGGPLKYRVEQNGYVVYSVGPDLADDGGRDEKQQQRGPDLVFRVAQPKSQ